MILRPKIGDEAWTLLGGDIVRVVIIGKYADESGKHKDIYLFRRFDDDIEAAIQSCSLKELFESEIAAVEQEMVEKHGREFCVRLGAWIRYVVREQFRALDSAKNDAKEAE